MEVFKQYFYLEEHKKDKCKKIQGDYSKALQAEQVIMSSQYSPGLVEDSESLARVLISPYMCNLKGDEVTPRAVEDIFNKGMSVNRVHYMESADDNLDVGQDMVDQWLGQPANKDKIRGNPGYLVGNAESLRAVTDVDSSSQIICVYDSANSEASYHADVCLVVKPNKKLKEHLKCEVLKCFDTKVVREAN